MRYAYKGEIEKQDVIASK